VGYRERENQHKKRGIKFEQASYVFAAEKKTESLSHSSDSQTQKQQQKIPTVFILSIILIFQIIIALLLFY